MAKELKLIGYEIVPFSRKVHVALCYKNLTYTIDPLNPFLEKPRLLPMNPRGQIPVLQVGSEFVPDSHGICEYLDEHYQTGPALFPKEPKERKRAFEIESWCDGTLLGPFVAGMFFQRIIKPMYLNRPSDEDVVKQCMEKRAPEYMMEIEKLVPAEGFLVSQFSVADIMLGSVLRGAMIAGFKIDGAKYPKTVSFLKRVYAIPAYKKVIEHENKIPQIAKAKEMYSSQVIE